MSAKYTNSVLLNIKKPQKIARIFFVTIFWRLSNFLDENFRIRSYEVRLKGISLMRDDPAVKLIKKIIKYFIRKLLDVFRYIFSSETGLVANLI